MQKSVYLLKRIAIAIEVIGLLVLLALFAKRNGQKNVYDVSMDDISTQCSEINFDGKQWSINEDDGNSLAGETYLLYGPGISLKRGTYTIVLNYNSSKIHKGVVEADEGVIDTADYFLLSNNKSEVRYDFILSTDAQGFKFRIKEFYGGEFSLNGMTIIRNSHDIRCMIFVWLILSLIVNMFLFVDRIRDNKYKIAVLFGIAFVASLPIFPKGMLTGDDIMYHLVRIDGLADGLKNGVFPVKMYSIYNDNYGYPVGIFYGDVLLYLPAILRIVGFTIMQSYKAYIFVINVLTVYIAYICGKKMFSSENKAYIYALAYTFSSYRMVCIYARAAMGEYSATCFYPLVILAVWNIYTKDIKDKEYKKNSLILAIGMAGLIYTHVLSTEMIILTLIVIAVVLFRKTFRKETLLIYIVAMIVCGLICAAFIIPFMEYYTGVDIMIKHRFAKSYIQSYGAYISDYFAFFKSIIGGNYPTRRMLFTPGLIYMTSLVAGIVLIVAGKADKKVKFIVCGAVISLFVASNICPWNIINDVPVIGSFLVSVQFPFRYIGIASCFLSVLTVLVLERVTELDVIKCNLYRVVAVSGVILTCLFASYYQDEAYVTSILRSYDSADLNSYTRTGDFGMVLGTIYLMDGTDMSASILDYEVYGENSTSAIITEQGVGMTLFVDAGENATVEIPRFAYPHFVARDKDGNKLAIDKGFNNRMKISFPTAYNGEIYIDFVEPWYWRFAEIISLLSVIGIIISLNRKTFVKEKM